MGIFWGLPTQAKIEREGQHSEAFVEQCIEMFQRHKQLYIQNVEFFNFHLSGNLLPDIKKQIKYNVVGYTSQPLNNSQAVTQFFEEV